MKGDASYGGVVFTLGYTNTSRRDEPAMITKLPYDFSRLGLEGVSTYALFVHGRDRIDPSTKAGVPNENEFNVDLQWRPKWSFLNGFSARFRHALVHRYQGPKDNQHNYPVIINYDLSLL